MQANNKMPNQKIESFILAINRDRPKTNDAQIADFVRNLKK